MTWILRPRRGKFTENGIPTAMPGHNAVIVLFGCILALVGWLGLNTSGVMLFTTIAPVRSVLVSLNTVLSAGSAVLASMAMTRVRFGKPDASLAANGWISGLVASSATAAFVRPVEAIIIGLVAGALTVLSVEVIELHMGVDDPAGAISSHATGGIWGVLAVGMFGTVPSAPGEPTNSGQFLAQLAAVATLLGFVLPLSYGLNRMLNRLLPQRVSTEGERQGLDLFELGAGAYPEFMTHRDELSRR
jgi:Amt family ammonium transporter